MKKLSIIAGAAVLAMSALTACNNGGSKSVDPADKAFGDSVATALGQFAGAQAGMSYSRMSEMQPEMAAKFKKESFLRGISAVLNADSADVAYYQGLQMGLQLVQPVNGISKAPFGFPVSKDRVLAAFKDTYMADSVGDINAYYANYQMLMTALQKRMHEKEQAAKENSPEAKENKTAGAEYLEKMVAEQGYTLAESGIAYKMESEGTEPKAARTDVVKVNYEGRHISGEVFDSGEGVVFRANNLVPGFTEALTMLGQGGKLTVVIPADLAYGVEGNPSIQPNETLVFDIELLEINPQ